ncbi:MAG: hypothetical protein ACMZ7B_05795 [Balneola sp.]
MRLILIAAILVFLAGCKSSHKLTGTDYIDLSVAQARALNTAFPQEIADSLGWGDLTSTGLKVKEELRFSLTSAFEPFHLYRISVKRKVEGESVLFWSRKRSMYLSGAHENMELYLKGKCKEIYQTENFEYCKPGYAIEPDWGKIYSTLESRNIWSIPDTSTAQELSAADSAQWMIHTQVRLGDYYRSYSHTNPENYSGVRYKSNLMAIISQLQMVSTGQEKPDNFNIYSGITTGVRGSAFKLCDESESWRFEGNLEELLKASGFPAEFESSGNLNFYVIVSGTIEDEWYGNRSGTGFTKIIRPSEINDFRIISGDTCPSNTP